MRNSRPGMGVLRTERFETARLFTPRVDRYSVIVVRTNRYSVPAWPIGQTARVLLRASHLVVYRKGQEVARHERLIAEGGGDRRCGCPR